MLCQTIAAAILYRIYNIQIKTESSETENRALTSFFVLIHPNKLIPIWHGPGDVYSKDLASVFSCKSRQQYN